MNDFERFQAYTVHFEISRFITLFNDTLIDLATNATDEEVILDESIDVKSVSSETSDYLELFSSWETWIYENYIFDPLKDVIKDNTLAGLNKKINETNGHKWLKKKLALDLRSSNSKSVIKKITVKSKKLVFNAFKVLAALNIFTFIGSFLLDYLIYSGEVDKAFQKYFLKLWV